MLDNFDPNTIEDSALRQVFVDLLNVVETLTAKVQVLQADNQALRDENARLKGEQGKPNIRPNLRATNLSSEKERRQPKTRSSKTKPPLHHFDRTEIVRLDPASLPKDAVSKGYEPKIVRDLSVQSQTICFRREKYYSPSQKQSYLADLPSEYAQGQYGPGVRSLVISLYYESGLTEPKIKQLLANFDLPVSAGLISRWLTCPTALAPFTQEAEQVLEAGLSSSAWQQLDDTATRVGGVNQSCLVLCNPLYTYYQTQPTKARLAVLRVLMSGVLHYRYNEEAIALLEAWQVSANGSKY